MCFKSAGESVRGNDLFVPVTMTMFALDYENHLPRRTKNEASIKTMSESTRTGFDLWTPNDYSNFITICAAAIGSTLLVIFKSRCVKISLCFGMWRCDREVASDSDTDEAIVPPVVDQP